MKQTIICIGCFQLPCARGRHYSGARPLQNYPFIQQERGRSIWLCQPKTFRETNKRVASW